MDLRNDQQNENPEPQIVVAQARQRLPVPIDIVRTNNHLRQRRYRAPRRKPFMRNMVGNHAPDQNAAVPRPHPLVAAQEPLQNQPGAPNAESLLLDRQL